MASYLVAGGAGFIGSHLARALLAHGEVRVLDNFSSGRHENLADIADRVEIVKGDLRDPRSCRLAVAGIDHVLHLGALPAIEHSVLHPAACMEGTVGGTMNLLRAARVADVKRIIFASSAAVYGDSPTLPNNEEMAPMPKSPYGVAVLAAEQSCQFFHQLYGLETICLRIFNGFGPGQGVDSRYAAVIPRFIQAMLSGEAPTIFGDGLQLRDFTYIDNIVHAILLALSSSKAAGSVLNIGCGQSRTLLDLVATLNAIMGTSFEPDHAPARLGEVVHSAAAIGRAKTAMGYKVEVGFLEGLHRSVDWYRGRVSQLELPSRSGAGCLESAAQRDSKTERRD